MTAWFQALFTPRQRCFSAFHHGTKCAIGLGTCLALEVGDLQFPRVFQPAVLREQPTSTTGYAYGALTLYGGAFQLTSASPWWRH